MGQARGGVGMYHHCRQVGVGLRYCDTYLAALYVDRYIVIHIKLGPWQLYQTLSGNCGTEHDSMTYIECVDSPSR
jgi:hypothetical protein